MARTIYPSKNHPAQRYGRLRGRDGDRNRPRREERERSGRAGLCSGVYRRERYLEPHGADGAEPVVLFEGV